MRPRITAAIAALALAVLGALAAPSTAHADITDCDAYTYTDGGASLCITLPVDRDVDCPEVGAPVTLSSPTVDPWNLDTDGDGHGCETQGPVDNPDPTPTASPSVTPSATPSATPSKTTRPSPSPTRSSEPAAAPAGRDNDDAPALPVTGPAAPWLVGGAVALLLAGGLALAVARRRPRFEA